MKRSVFLPLLVTIFLVIGTALVILYGKGYRLGFGNGQAELTKTGILNATSTPQGAQVYLNGHLTSATNNAINLIPAQYAVKITKEGYADWQKNFDVKAQIVSNTNAVLFPISPTLQSISSVGVTGPVLDPSGGKLAFRIASQASQLKTGIYVLDMTTRSFPVLPVQSSSTQIVNDTLDNFSAGSLRWSPDGQQILASISGTLGSPTYYLLQANQFNSSPQDVTAILQTIEDQWQTQIAQKEKARMDSLSKKLQQTIASNFSILGWSPDDTKILYQASISANLPFIINPRRIGNNLLYEQRTISKGGIYVYNTQEDINTRILDSSPTLCDTASTDCHIPINWFPDSSHLLYVHDKKIDIVEDDGANTTTIYSGPFVDSYVYPWPDGSKLVILTNFNNLSAAPTFYTISLR